MIASVGMASRLRAEGLPVGKWIFYPSVDAVWQSEDNLFLSNVDPESATSYAVRPRLQWEFPFRESRFKIAYSPQVRTFVGRDEASSGLQKSYYSHFADMDTKLVFSNQVSVQVHDEYVVDALETIHFDPGQSVPFGNNNQYRRNHADAEVLAPLGSRHGVGVQAMHEFLRFDEGDVPLFLDYTRAGGGVVYVYRVSPISQLKFGYVMSSADQERPGSTTQHFDTQDVTVRLEGGLGRNGLTESTLGFTRWDFRDPSQRDFSGVTGEFRYWLLLNEKMKLTTTLARYPLQSFFSDNDYYLTTNADVKFEHEAGPRLYYNLAVAYRINDFPEHVVFVSPAFDGERSDRIWRGEAAVGCKFADTLRAELRYRRERRVSNLDTAEYGSNRVILNITFGWR